MNPSVISESVWQALGWAMLHFLWVGALLGVLLFSFERLFLRRASASVRYGQGLISLLALVVTAALCVWHEWPESGSAGGVAEIGAVTYEDVPAPLFPIQPTVSYPLEEGTGAPLVEVMPSVDSKQWIGVLPWLWCLGSTAFAAVFALGLTGIWRLRRAADSSSAVEIQSRCDQLRAGLGISRRVAVAISRRVQAPLLVGIVRPLIILPVSALNGMSPAMVEWIILHELAHVRRWDNVVIPLQRLIECLLFFHPCVWIASRWVDREREFCCDRYALAKNDADPVGYAHTLAALAGVTGPSLVPASNMASHAVLRRIRRVLRAEKSSSSRCGGAAVGMLLGLLLIAGMAWAAAQGRAAVSAQPESEPVVSPEAEAPAPAQSVAEKPPEKALVLELPPGLAGGIVFPATEENNAPQPLPAPAGVEPRPNAILRNAYRVPPDFLSQLPGDGTLQNRLTGLGLRFPKGTLALFEPRTSMVVLHHDAATIAKITGYIESLVATPGPQIYLTSKLFLKRGEDQKVLSAPSVVTRSGQRAKIEVIRELIHPVADVDGKPAFEMTPLGLSIDFDPLASPPSLDVHMAGSVEVRLLKGTSIDEFFANNGVLGDALTIDHLPELVVHRQSFEQTRRSGGMIEVELGEIAGKEALLKRNRLAPGTLSAKLTVQLLDAAGHALETEEALRKAYPKFKMRAVPVAREAVAIPPHPGARAAGDRMFAAALAAYDLGDYPFAESAARSGLAYAPEDPARLNLWKQASAAVKDEKRRLRPTADLWVERSYRLRPPLMPGDCATDRSALLRFLKGCGMALPAGATVRVGDDRETLLVHNLGREIAKLETELRNRVDTHAGGGVWVDVDVVAGAKELEGAAVAWLPQGKLRFGIAGVFSEEQYRVVRRNLDQQLKVTSMPRRRIVRQREIDVLADSPLAKNRVRAACLLRAQVSADGYTIDTDLAPEVYEVDANNEKILSTRRPVTAVTVWDGQWIALSNTTDAGTDLVFIRIQVAKL